MGNNPCGWYPNIYLPSVLNMLSPSLTTSTLPNQATSEVSIVLMIHCRYAGHSLQPAQHKYTHDWLMDSTVMFSSLRAPATVGVSRPQQVDSGNIQGLTSKTDLCALAY